MCGSRKSRRCRRSATTIANRPSGVKYRLYGSSTGIGRPGTAGARVDRCEAVAEVVVHVQRPQVVGRRHVLGQRPDRELRDDLQRPLADHVDGVAQAVRHVDERRIAAHDRAEVARQRPRCTRSRPPRWPPVTAAGVGAGVDRATLACSTTCSRDRGSTRSRRGAAPPARRRRTARGRRMPQPARVLGHVRHASRRVCRPTRQRHISWR